MFHVKNFTFKSGKFFSLAVKRKSPIVNAPPADPKYKPVTVGVFDDIDDDIPF